MKKIIIIFLIGVSLSAKAQEKKEYPQDVHKKTELKINAFNLIVIPAIDVSYERLINENSSFGVSLFVNVDDDDYVDFPRKFSLTPYYRWFFSETRYARGFFLEGFGALNTTQNDVFNSNSKKEENLTRFALGVSVGGKFVTKKGFTTEVFLGVGRNLIGKNGANEYIDNDVVGRFGVSIGYRF